MTRDEQCQAFRHMLQSLLPFNWSLIVTKQTHEDALEYLLSKRPDFAKHSFGKERQTLLHAVCNDRFYGDYDF